MNAEKYRDEYQESYSGTSLVVQWVRVYAPNVGCPGLIPGQGTRYRILQLRTDAAKINFFFKRKLLIGVSKPFKSIYLF